MERWWKSLQQQDSGCLLFQNAAVWLKGKKRKQALRKLSKLMRELIQPVQINKMMFYNGPEFLPEFFEQKLPDHPNSCPQERVQPRQRRPSSSPLLTAKQMEGERGKKKVKTSPTRQLSLGAGRNSGLRSGARS